MDPFRVVVIDAYELTFIDSVGLGALARRVHLPGAEVSVVGASKLHKFLFGLTTIRSVELAETGR